MAIDDNKLIFSSLWDIDQMVKSGTKRISVTGTAEYELVDFSDLGLTYSPQYFIAWRRVGKTRWNMEGASSGFDDAGYFDSTYMYPLKGRVTPTKLYARGEYYNGTVDLDVRYIIYRNKATA